ncbi:acyl-CoA dehydrogenase NM domain-like protein [Heliocybe sulcata]|uniref:Acyl-CoA dehydrogenase NM domain-like protein n=1 Tax=Heliocybe sulcata TaxID=5364 RepID=A0A5C3MKZ1_9AGAM|nr:acyl-CoA dehydrogenase NM domain-like protein [Heliocybe sulcata]
MLSRSVPFRRTNSGLLQAERVKLSYERTKAIVQAYRLTANDILHLSEKYWEFHTDPILVTDGGAGTLSTIHYNLCSGTLAMFTAGRTDIARVLSDLLEFNLCGQYCLTELGHGLDAINLETTVTKLEDGQLELHTPAERAAKFMPPTVPCGIPCVAIVFARLIVRGEDRGVKPFLVPLHDGEQMYEGITSKQLPMRGGTDPVCHALTYFDRVLLPPTALLGGESKATDPRAAFFGNISRVISGTLSMGAFAVSALRIGCCVAGRYSLRRTVTDASERIQRPIISFSTQYIPVLVGIAQATVMRVFADVSHSRFTDSRNSLTVKHFIAAVFKTTVFQHVHTTLPPLGDRCGAQGLFEVNQLSVLHANMRGAAIAEGDILGISIRFAVEVVLGRIVPPPPLNSDHILARRETGLIQELRETMLEASGHRSRKNEAILLPQCQGLMEAIGHRLAIDSATEKGIDARIVKCYLASVMSLDEAWYVEREGFSRSVLKAALLDAATSLYPDMDHLLSTLQADLYVTAPIVSDDRWRAYTEALPSFRGQQGKRSDHYTRSLDMHADQGCRAGQGGLKAML